MNTPRRVAVAITVLLTLAAGLAVAPSTATAVPTVKPPSSAPPSLPPQAASYTETQNADGTTSIVYKSDVIPVSVPQPDKPRPSADDIAHARANGNPNAAATLGAAGWGLGHRIPVATAGWYGPWGPGCYWTYTYWADKNVYGQILRESWIIVNNWCFDGKVIYADPWARFQSDGQWGWTDCGWNNPWQGWIRWTQEWAAGGTAVFGFGKCAYSGWPHNQFLHVYENGWRYTS